MTKIELNNNNKLVEMLIVRKIILELLLIKVGLI